MVTLKFYIKMMQFSYKVTMQNLMSKPQTVYASVHVLHMAEYLHTYT